MATSAVRCLTLRATLRCSLLGAARCRDRAHHVFSEQQHAESQEQIAWWTREGGDDPNCLESGSASKPPAAPLSLSSTLSNVMAGLKSGRGALEAVLSSAYTNIAASLDTTIGLE
eukprot:350893-Chlamydomonas_euryale.AAC.2